MFMRVTSGVRTIKHDTGEAVTKDRLETFLRLIQGRTDLRRKRQCVTHRILLSAHSGRMMAPETIGSVVNATQRARGYLVAGRGSVVVPSMVQHSKN